MESISEAFEEENETEVTTLGEAKNHRVAKPSIYPYMKAQLKGTKGVDEDYICLPIVHKTPYDSEAHPL
jgi:hypothetical protein